MKKTLRMALILVLSLFVFLPGPGLFAGATTPKIEHTLNQNLHVQLPPSMQVFENPLGERKQLLYSAYMNDDNLLLRGYIQVWQLDDVEKFLTDSKEMSSYSFYSYTLNKITVGNLDGLLNAWGASFGEQSKISGKEYWLRKSGSSEVLRIEFLTSDVTFSDLQVKMISQILASLRWEQ